MAGISVDVKPEIINWILHTIQPENVAGSAIELLHKWKTGEKVPTFNQIKDMSKKTNVPFGYFFLDKPPVEKCPIVEYRTIDSTMAAEPSRNLVDTVDLMTDIQEWMVEYAVENGQEELEYVGSVTEETDVRFAADNIRKRLDMDVDWYAHMQNAGESFRHVKRKMESIHVLVMMSGIVGNNTRRKLSIDEFRAFTLVSKYAPLIFINSCDSDNGKLFSILHELAHVWVGENSFYNAPAGVNSGKRKVERFCNAVAAEILVPSEIFLEKWKSSNDEISDKIEKIAKNFRCSRFVVARKALEHGKISQEVYERMVREYTRKFEEWQKEQKEKRESGGSYYRNLASKLDRNFILALARSAAEGRTQYAEIYRLTNTNRKTFGKLLEGIGWTLPGCDGYINLASGLSGVIL